MKRAKKAIKKAVLTTKKVVKKAKAAMTKAKQQVMAAVKQTKQVVKEKVLPVVKKAAQATTKAVINVVKPKNMLNTLQVGLDLVGLIPGVGEIADGVNGVIYLARGDKVNASLSFGAMIPFVGWASTGGKFVKKGAGVVKSVTEGVQKALNGPVGSVVDKVKKQVVNVKTQIQSKVAEVKQQLRQMLQPPQRYELAGAGGDVRYIEDTGTVGRNTTTPSPKPSNTQPSQNGSNKKPAEDKGTGKYTGGRTQKEFDDLAGDPSHGGKIRDQGLKEREIGLDLEQQGKLGKIIRDPQGNGGAEFIDTTNNTKWDVKSFVSYPNGHTSPKKGAFTVSNGMKGINKELEKNYNVIVDVRDMVPEHVEQLKEAIEKAGVSNRIIWYP
ncbi:hypothetical protein D0439_08010 [Lysinibacillus fusiformis]|uniref:hypothetical protein n=1 Tax=Lysinibacillus fusiformis TaxID=28031 RepID=UPI0011BB83A0|nr:hypothetical protein [Lysinibacillus fusiformis]QDZ98572.1 hypothetical protein D0439_08010 [Lysinibacillus fusiformis]